MATLSTSRRSPFAVPVAVVAGLLASASFVSRAGAGDNEPPACLSPDPAQWPAPAKPYFMLAVDTSSAVAEPLPLTLCSVNSDCVAAGSGTTCTCLSGGAQPCGAGNGTCNGTAPPCAGYPSTRNGHERCALQNTINAFGGQVNFGLAGFPLAQSACTGALTCAGNAPFSCFTDCTYTAAPGDPVQTSPGFGCGPIPGGLPANREGANLLVPMLWDHFWQTTPATCTTNAQCPTGVCLAGSCQSSNVAQLLQLVDNSSASSAEVWATGKAPVNGMLRDMYRYLAGTYVNPVTGAAVPTPLDPTNERSCRSVNIILITAGDENCDTYADATAAATSLYAGVTVGNFTWNVRTHVIAFVGGKNAAVLAGNGASATQLGTTAGQGYYTNPTNSVALSQALANIVGSAIQPEVCDNVDNNCNGCTDEGFNHYCDQGQTCCTLARATCLANYQASITPSNPQGDPTQLPCTTASAGGTPATWLCYNPGDVCDGTDNNCDGQVDEGATKCGSPLHCPMPETCNGQDDNCDGIVDNADGGAPFSICPSMCQPAPEICDGCDNDCDGTVDDNVPNAACGLPPNPPQTPTYCAGVLTCTPQGNVTPGTCVSGGGKTQCVYPSPGLQPEVCNGIDDNCNGIVDDGIPSVPCVPAGQPQNLVYGGLSQCKMGQTQCIGGATVCVGWVGPSAEVCDGLDNNCNGQVDEGTLPGTGQACGTSLGACKPGKTVCVSGVLVCQGGVGPTPEVCDGLDNDCNGLIDDGPLTDAPPTPGCWDLPGNCCSYVDAKTGKTTSWCPPAGATCTGLGSLVSPPCAAGVLECEGASGWVCKNGKDPQPEVCNGLDDNCNGLIDDGVLPAPVGQTCGSNVGACKPGVYVCVGGKVACNGVGPTPEVCDGIDNDCDGTVDDNVPGTGVACQVAYDTTAYPGARNHPPCKPGITQCDSALGMLVCQGGVGPSPEVCDGLDNDCDGLVDEQGAPPDGINGTADPSNPAEVIGQTCGNSVGECMPGTWACGNGMFVCSGGVLPQPETCDCKDNDCDGTVDNPNDGGVPPLCSTGKDCVKSALGCGCAEPCGSGEFPCPAGQTCVQGTINGTDGGVGSFCVASPCPDCTKQTIKDSTGSVLCAPAGTPADPTTCITPPVCVCQGQAGCQTPCFGVTCAGGTVCSDQGANAGKCVADTCFNVPCTGCGKVCNGGTCVDDPCTATSCPAGKECLPSPDFTTFTCVTACGSLTCPSGQTCASGACVPTCNPACASGQTCDTSQTPPACVTDKCNPSPCTDSSCCNPVTGACGNCACTGILCPTGDTCQDGQCVAPGMTTSTSSSSAGSSSSGAGTGGGGSGTGGATGVFGLATGGGGCFCGVGPGSGRLSEGRWALLAIAVALGRRRRRGSRVRGPDGRGSQDQEVAR